jgi:putative PIN family toxin of toxin-antitoxin system
VFGVTLDTNIYVSALEFGGAGARILGMARAGMFRIDVSDAILDELLTVLRDDFRWDGYRLHFAREQIANVANRVVPPQTLDVIKEDPDDNRILECAVEAKSDFIVSWDKDVLRLGSYGDVRMVTAKEFIGHDGAAIDRQPSTLALACKGRCARLLSLARAVVMRYTLM